MPSEEPQLLSELMLKSWPRRQWAARLYHALMPPPERPDPTLFENLEAVPVAATHPLAATR
jgi:hypothetical protein